MIMRNIYIQKIIAMRHKVQRSTSFNALLSFRLPNATELTGKEKAQRDLSHLGEVWGVIGNINLCTMCCTTVDWSF